MLYYWSYLLFYPQALLLVSAAAVAMAQYGHGGYGGEAYGAHDYVSKTSIFTNVI